MADLGSKMTTSRQHLVTSSCFIFNFMLYLVYSKVSKENIVSRHSILHFLSEFETNGETCGKTIVYHKSSLNFAI